MFLVFKKIIKKNKFKLKKRINKKQQLNLNIIYDIHILENL